MLVGKTFVYNNHVDFIEWQPTPPIVWLTNQNFAAASDCKIESIGALIAGALSPLPSLFFLDFPNPSLCTYYAGYNITWSAFYLYNLEYKVAFQYSHFLMTAF